MRESCDLLPRGILRARNVRDGQTLKLLYQQLGGGPKHRWPHGITGITVPSTHSVVSPTVVRLLCLLDKAQQTRELLTNVQYVYSRLEEALPGSPWR